uniref:H15 domain-containing protein n=1 Tax=Knipowitschia caucasica TaxID=637954 RepID=A0AAV2MTJ9_KNICA
MKLDSDLNLNTSHGRDRTRSTRSDQIQGPQEEGRRKKSDGPNLGALIKAAIAESKERKGVSVAAVKKALAAKGVDVVKANKRINNTLKRMVLNGVKKVVKKAKSPAKKAVKKPAAKSPKKVAKKPAAKSPKKVAKKPAKKVTPKKPKAVKKSPKKAAAKKAAPKKAKK